VKNLRKTLSLFLQAAPETMDIHQIEQQLLSLEQVQSTHHTHIWSLDGEHHVLSTHVVLADDVSKNDLLCVREEIKFKLKQFDLSHSTIEIEFGEDDCMMIDELA
jgi:cobalt-zinc-cadmium efflux system protein